MWILWTKKYNMKYTHFMEEKVEIAHNVSENSVNIFVD
jgi:hypothetical protein